MRQMGDFIGAFREPPGSSKTYSKTYYVVRWFKWSLTGMKYLAIGQIKEDGFYPVVYFHDIMDQPGAAKEVYVCS